MEAAQLDEYPMVAYMDDSYHCNIEARDAAGCFTTATPHTIYIQRDLPRSLEHLVVLHELAHYYQYHNGLELSECGADEIAASWGADISLSAYQEECRP
jgi:hypothetical protein